MDIKNFSLSKFIAGEMDLEKVASNLVGSNLSFRQTGKEASGH